MVKTNCVVFVGAQTKDGFFSATPVITSIHTKAKENQHEYSYVYGDPCMGYIDSACRNHRVLLREGTAMERDQKTNK